jgi:aspartyl-tRNA(Asn)/glutamyl-tRNA(Gln) amidotransferase subunit C
MKLTLDDVRRIAHLARIEIDAQAAREVHAKLESIFAMIDQLQAIDTTGIEPMSHAQDVVLALRDDKVTERDRHEDYQKVAPAVADGPLPRAARGGVAMAAHEPDTVAGLAARLAKREVSAVEVARDALDRIAKVGPTLNAFLQVDEEGALAAAKAADARSRAARPARSPACRSRTRTC